MLPVLQKRLLTITIVAFSVLVAGLAYLGGRLILAEQQIAYLTDVQDAQRNAATSASAILAVQFKAAAQHSADLEQKVSAQDQASAALHSVLSGVQGDLDTIAKERANDPELLQKYSKVYFLNENYRPASLSTIDPLFSSPTTTVREIQSQVLPFLTRLLSDAGAAGSHLRIASAYRSFYDQETLKGEYTVKYGSGANAFSADQGYSEHELGTTVDFTTAGTGGLTGFEKTASYQWLMSNAYRYGFVLSYPKGNTYYIYEPWHWRFVGVALATKLHDTGKNFYDLDQREIDTYRAHMFDQ